MGSLTEFLLERVAEDEAEAQVFDENWSPVRRRLAECKAKREIVELYEEHNDCAQASMDLGESDECCAFAAQGLFAAIHVLVDVYADHPDYREQWKL